MKFTLLLTSVISALALLPSAHAWGKDGSFSPAPLSETRLLTRLAVHRARNRRNHRRVRIGTLRSTDPLFDPKSFEAGIVLPRHCRILGG